MNTTEPKRARRRWLVVVLVLLLAVVSIVLVLPGQLAPWAVQRSLTAFDARHAGELTVDGFDVGWFAATRITDARLLDPAGEEVARADVRGPSLWNLAKGFGRDLGTLHVEGRAALVADESGTTNLARALESTAPEREPGERGPRDGEPTEPPRVRVEFLLHEVTWTDPRQPDVLGVRELVGHVELNGDASFALEGAVLGADGGRLQLAGEVERPLAPLAGDAPPAYRVSGDVRSLATGLVDALAGADGLLVDQLGATFDLTLAGEGTTRAGTLEARLTSEGADAEAWLALEEGVVREREGQPVLRAELRRLDAAVARFSEHLPAGAALDIGAEGATLVVASLRAPLAAFEGAKSPAALVELALALRLPRLVYQHAAKDAGPTRIDIADVALDVGLEPATPARLALRAAVGEEPRGTLTLDATQTDPFGTPRGALRFEARFADVATALVDALAQRDGLLVDVLGPRLDGWLTGEWPSEDVPLKAHFESASGAFDVTTFFEDGVLRAENVGALEANVALSPLFSERIVGNLVPHLVQIRKNEPTERVGLSVANFRLPLDGDLRQLSADVLLDLGPVRYELLPGLDEVLKLAGVDDLTRSKDFEPLRMRIENGLVRYERLPLSFEGQDYPFAGSFDLAERAFDLEAELPLSLLGSSVVADLGRATSLLSGDTLVPIQLEGTLTRPRLSIPSDFAEKLLERAGGDLLRRGLRDLFGDK
ncbi:MAG: hypothetical protein WD226_05990 [Planctomycetota bacterium]